MNAKKSRTQYLTLQMLKGPEEFERNQISPLKMIKNWDINVKKLDPAYYAFKQWKTTEIFLQPFRQLLHLKPIQNVKRQSLSSN